MSAIADSGATRPRELGNTFAASYTLALLTLIYAFNTADRNLLGLLVPLMKDELGLSDTWIGVLSGMTFAVFYALAGLPIAALADRWNRCNIIAIGFVFWSLMTAATGFVQNVWQLACARFALGIGEATGVAPSNSMIADLFGPARRPFALAVFAAASPLGIMVAFPLIGWIAHEYGWRMGFIVAGLPGILVALLFWISVREPQRGQMEDQASGEAIPLATTIRFLARSPAYVLAVTCGVFIVFNLSTMQTWVPMLLARVHGLNAAEMGLIVGALRGPAGLVGALLGGWLATRLARRDPRWLYRVPAYAMLLMVPAELLLLFSSDVAAWRIGLAAETAFGMAQIGPLFAILLSAARARMRAVAISIFLIVTQIVGQSSGPLAVGMISDALTPTLGAEAIRYALLIAVVAAAAAGALCFAAGRFLEADTRRAAT